MLNSKLPTWEELHASKLLSDTDAIKLLECDEVLQLLNKPMSSDVNEITKWLFDEKMSIDVQQGKGYYITNFGVIASR